MSLNILLLSSSPSSSSSLEIKERCEKRKHKVRVLSPDDMYPFLSEANGNDRIYLKSEERIFLKDIDRVIVRIGGSLYGRYIVRHLTLNMGKFCTTRASGIERCSDKFRTAQNLSANRIKIIPQVLTREVKESNTGYLVNLLGGIPFVFKVLTGSQGVGVGLIDSEQSAGTTIESISNFAKNVLLQRFIETKDENERSSDIRIFIVDGEVVASMKRYSKARQFRSNFSISSLGEKYDPTEEQKEIALNAAAVCKSLGVCGVDLMVDESGTNYVVEVNSNPGFKIEKVTGINVIDKIIDFAERGKLSKEALERYEKFDINAQLIKKGYRATGNKKNTRIKGLFGFHQLHEVMNLSTGEIRHFDATKPDRLYQFISGADEFFPVQF